jgi:hypothetical protein
MQLQRIVEQQIQEEERPAQVRQSAGAYADTGQQQHNPEHFQVLVGLPQTSIAGDREGAGGEAEIGEVSAVEVEQVQGDEE